MKELLARRSRRAGREFGLCITATAVTPLLFSGIVLGSLIGFALIRPILLPGLFDQLLSSAGCPLSSKSTDPWHSMSDEELMRRASMVRCTGRRQHEKVAFMFLVRGRLPLRPLWERFFEGHRGFYSIYLHASSPELVDRPPEESVFFNRRIPGKAAGWGQASLVDAERRLLANALLDSSNERFVLLSESCIPLSDFRSTYAYLVGSGLSFLSSFEDPRTTGLGHYNESMWPVVTTQDWRKGSQWFAVRRELALEIVSDTKYYPLFREHCSPRCRPPCYMDEHYLATMVSKNFPKLNSNRSVTWVDWSRGGSHPASFRRKDISESLLRRIRNRSNCGGGGSGGFCFLFARKFDASTLRPLLKLL